MIEIFGHLIPVFVTAMIGYAVGWYECKVSFRKKAIDANVAEWTIDPKTGDKEFQFISPKQPLSGTGRG